MKLLKSTLIIPALQYASAERQYLGTLPFNKCGSITEPQKGFWVGRGEGSTKQLSFHPECEAPGNENGKCTIMCKNYNTKLVLDRSREGAWDRALDPEVQKKYLVKCKCKAWLEDDGTVTTEDCEWSPRRYWKENDYREEYELGDAGIGEEPWKQPVRYPEDAVISRKKRGLSQPRMTFYCEDEAPEHITSNWNLKPVGESVRKYAKWNGENKGFPTCGSMYEHFPNNGGEWRCKLNTINESDGSSTKIDVDANDVPHKAVCAWGCGEGNNWEAKEARLSCVRPWHGRENTRYAETDVWRRFRGYGVRVYKQGMMNCEHFDDGSEQMK